MKGVDLIMKKHELCKYNFNMKKLRLFDSFAGIGALHQSLKELGVPVELVGASEIDINAIISYSGVHNLDVSSIPTPSVEEMRKYLIDRNIGFSFEKGTSSIPRLNIHKLEKCYKASVAMNNLGDISKIDYRKIPDFDLFNFSFPCTDISIAGRAQGMTKDDGSVTRSGLYIYGIEVIKSKRPSYVLIENVKGLIQKKFIGHFFDIINEVETLGYNCYYPKKKNGQPTCLNAKEFGVPQNRERIFIICVKKDIDTNTFKFPEGKDYGIRLKDILEKKVDEKYYLSQQIQDRFHLNGEKDTPHNKINVVGSSAPETRTIGQRDITYGTNGIIGALTATDYKQPKQILGNNVFQKRTDYVEKKYLEFIKENGHVPELFNPYNSREIIDNSPTLTTSCGSSTGCSSVLVMRKEQDIKINSNNEINKVYDIPKDILNDNERQRRVYNDEGISPSILARPDSTKILDNNLKFLGGVGTRKWLDDGKNYSRNFTQGNRVYDSSGICATLTALGGGLGGIGGGLYRVEVQDNNKIIQLNNPPHSQQRIYSTFGISPTICAGNNGGEQTPCKHITNTYRIRKLTPTECWVLMGFKPEHINRAIALGLSDSSLYKQAGNSIVVNVLYYIFKELFSNFIVE